LPQISRYLADASTNLGLVATVAGLMVWMCPLQPFFMF
jgi:hypothetical protein